MQKGLTCWHVYLRQWRGPGGATRAMLAPLTVQMQSVTEEDWSLVFTTSNGHVRIAPTVPPHLRETESKKTDIQWKLHSVDFFSAQKIMRIKRKENQYQLKAWPHNVGQSCNNFLSESHVTLVKHHNTDLEENKGDRISTLMWKVSCP